MPYKHEEYKADKSSCCAFVTFIILIVALLGGIFIYLCSLT